MLRLRVLGSAELTDGRGAELIAVLAQPKRFALLVYLVVSPGFQRRDTILALFWPELTARRARGALNQAIGFLRKELGGNPESVIVSRGGAELGIDSSALWCDVTAFREHVHARHHTEALDLYRGDLLPGLHAVHGSEFDEWLEGERVQLRASASRAAREVAQEHERACHYTTAVTSARRAVELSGHDERAVRDLLTLLDRLGDRAGAVNAYEEFGRRLATELGAAPSAETLALVTQIRGRAGVADLAMMPPQLSRGSEWNGWRMIRELGRGGMATVHLALDVKHDRHVAIKQLKAELATRVGAELFLREIQIMARLAHPHILPLIDSGTREGRPYLVTPYVAGESLRARLGREHHMPLDEALRLTMEIAQALDYAHRRGVIHCDIKPENILLADGHAVVADFGIARAILASGARDSDDTLDGVVLGSPPYMSPEALQGASVGVQADIYALGCVMVEMLTGEVPSTGEVPGVRERFGAGIARLAAECIAADATQRPKSAADVVRRLEETARPTSARRATETDVGDSHAEILARLVAHRTLGGAPRSELEWLAARGTIRRYDVGEIFVPPGATSDEMIVIFKGVGSIIVDRAGEKKKLLEWHAGDVTGLLPYSRMKRPPGLTTTESPIEGLVVHRELFVEMARECPWVTETLVHIMVDRSRQFAANDR